MVDLRLVAQQIRLDQFAVEVSQALSSAGIPHALLKGPTTANWLYDVPRPYSDVDMLIPRSRVDDSVKALGRVGLAQPSGGRLGEEASHSLMMESPAGIELDLHAALPLMSLPRSSTDDTVWDTLVDHLIDFEIDGVAIPALDISARCLVLSLHAVSGGSDRERVQEDLRRAWRAATEAQWQQAVALGDSLGVTQLMRLGISTVDQGWADDSPPIGGRLLLNDNSGAFQLQRLSELPRRQIPAALWREVFPTSGFMYRRYPDYRDKRLGLVRAYVFRFRTLGAQLPTALAVWRRERPQHPGSTH